MKSKPGSQEEGRPSSRAQRFDKLLGAIDARLGLGADAGPLRQRQTILSPAGFPCRLLEDDEASPDGALFVAVDLPLSVVELEPRHFSHLFRMQTVLASSAGWTLDATPDDGQLRVVSLRAVSTPDSAVGELEAGSWLARYLMQELGASIDASSGSYREA